MTRLALLLLVLFIVLNKNAYSEPVSNQANKLRDDPILASVDNLKITVKDFKREYNILPEYLKGMANTPQGRLEMLETMVVREMILLEARKVGIDKYPELAEKLKDLKNRLIVESYLKMVTTDVVPDNELLDFYNKNKAKFMSKNQIRVSHILVKKEKEAEDILTKIAAGAAFEDLARTYSIDSSATKGGDLGWFGTGTMVPTFEEAAFNLKEDQISNIVRTDFGYHIIKMKSRQSERLKPFSEVKDEVKAAILPKKQQDSFQKLKSTLKQNIPFNINESAVRELNFK